MAAPQGKPYDFNAYAAGAKRYGGGRSAPNVGMMLDPMGYRERELENQAKRNALLRRLKANAKRNFMSSAWLGGPRS